MSKTHSSALTSFILLSLYSSSVLAANDWAKPCFNGTCSYDLPDDPSGPSGTLKIWGSNTAIADITTAGGWEVIGCDPNKQVQDIRIVCKGIDIDGDGDNDGCSHLFANGLSSPSKRNEKNATTTLTSLPVPTGTVVNVGDNSTSTDEDQRANGKIVRLPEECGKQAFARIAKTWTHKNQTIPSHISKRLAPFHRRTQHRHKVKGLTIDTQFHKSNSAQHGAVNFAIVGANVPGAKATANSAVPSLKSSGHSGQKRSFVHSRIFSQKRGWGSIIHDVGDTIGDGAGAIGGAISDGAGAVGGAIGDGVDAIGDALSGTKSFNNSVSTPLDISKTFTLLDQSITCTDKFTIPGINGSTITPTVSANGQMKVDVEAGVKGTVTVGVAASGSLTDLRVDSFELSTKLDADLTGAIVMSAGVGGSIDSGKIKFFELGIPGFDFPGILSIGPTFQINGQAKVSLNVDTNMRIGLVYHIGELQFAFPGGGKQSGTFNPGDTPLQLSAQPSAKATGKVEAHLIPSLNVGINAFEGITKAEVFANLDAYASMTLTEDVTLPSVQANITLREEKPAVEAVRPVIRGRGAIGAYYLKKRSPAPEPSELEDIVEAMEKASEAIADGVQELKDILEHPNPSSSPIPTPTENSTGDSPNIPSPASPTATKSSPTEFPNTPSQIIPAPVASSPGPNIPSPTVPTTSRSLSEDPKPSSPATPTATKGLPGGSPNAASPAVPTPPEMSPGGSPNKPSPAIPTTSRGSAGDSLNNLSSVNPTATKSSPGNSLNTPPPAIDLKDPDTQNSASSAEPAATKGSSTIASNSSMTIETAAGSSTTVHADSSSSVVPTAIKGSLTVAPNSSSSKTTETADGSSPTAHPNSSSSVLPATTKGSATVAPNSSSSLTIETVAGSSATTPPKSSSSVITTAAASSLTASPSLLSSMTIETAATSPSSVPSNPASTSLSSSPTTTGSSTSASPKPSDSLVVSDQVTFGGCLEVDVGLNANVGADANFFGLFNPSKTIPLFQKQFTLYKKCYGDQKKRRSIPDLSSMHAVLVGRDLQCNGGNSSLSGLEKLADEIVSALNIL